MIALIVTATLWLHSTAELSDWYAEWLSTPATSDVKTAELTDMEQRHPCFPVACVQAPIEEVQIGAPLVVHTGMGTNVEQWRSLVSAHFLASDVNLALRVIACESGGNPHATNASSAAAGLFQHIPRYWPERSTAAGWAGANIYDPAANVAVAAWLATTQGWHHWNASRGCW